MTTYKLVDQEIVECDLIDTYKWTKTGANQIGRLERTINGRVYLLSTVFLAYGSPAFETMLFIDNTERFFRRDVDFKSASKTFNRMARALNMRTDASSRDPS